MLARRFARLRNHNLTDQQQAREQDGPMRFAIFDEENESRKGSGKVSMKHRSVPTERRLIELYQPISARNTGS